MPTVLWGNIGSTVIEKLCMSGCVLYLEKDFILSHEYFFLCLFIFERQKEKENEWGRGRE